MNNEEREPEAFETLAWLGAAAFCFAFWAMVASAFV
jgi:hypothetical protein